MANSSPFSFHCMICFEEFDEKVRYPVVLPCAHTYICNECASRIDRCMECRTSVFAESPSNNEVNQPDRIERNRTTVGISRSSMASARSGRTRVSSEYRRQFEEDWKPKPKTVKTRLPLPKNLVLLSLMNASGTNNADDDSTFFSDGAPDNRDLAEEEEEEKIKLGTEIAIGACGTYAVARRQGLEIVQDRPSSRKSRKLKPASSSEQLEQNVQDIIVSASSSRIHRSRSNSKGSILDVENDNSEFFLNYGDRVQVVTFVGGRAKLARGYGYVHCENRSDLVKVGGPIDKACKIEALILSHSLRKNRLRGEQASEERKARQLVKEMRSTLMEEEDVTVVDAGAFTGPLSSRRSSKKKAESRDDTDHMLLNSSSTSNSREHTASNVKKTATVQEKRTGTNGEEGVSCIADFFSNLLFPSHNEGSGESYSLFTSPSTVGESDIVAGAERWRQRNGTQAVSDTTDFRTGLSGHLGPQSNYASPQSQQRSGTLKMSCHSGLTMGRRNSNTSLSSSFW